MTDETTRWLRFRAGDPDAEILLRWHGSLSETRGDRAELRRCRSVDEVILVPAYHRLRLALLAASYRRFDEDRLALIAVLVAEIREHEPAAGGVAEQMARAKQGSGPAVSVARFRRLLAREQPDELLLQLRRIVHQLGRRADLVDLARTLLDWTRRPRQRTGRLRWAEQYYTRVVDAD